MLQKEESHDAQSQLLGLENLITTMFNRLQLEVLIDELDTSDMGLNKKGQEIIDTFIGMTVFEAIEHCRKMYNAIQNERNKRVVDLKVEDLDIILLDPNE